MHCPEDMYASLEGPRTKMVDTSERSMPKSKVDRSNIIATRYSGSLLLVGIEVETLSTEQPLKQLP